MRSFLHHFHPVLNNTLFFEPVAISQFRWIIISTVAETLTNQQLSSGIVGAVGFFNSPAFVLIKREPISMVGVGGLNARNAIGALRICIYPSGARFRVLRVSRIDVS